MRTTRNLTSAVILSLVFVGTAFAEDGVNATPSASKDSTAEKRAAAAPDHGTLTGSFETNTIYYLDDPATNAVAPDNHYGSNNYLKLDWRRGKISAGIQAEYYPQALQGYETTRLKGFRLPEKYITWTDKYFSVTAGDFYDQFGSGLLFRSWEDRTLGFNNSVFGGRVTFNAAGWLQGKIIGGVVRDYMGADSSSFLNTYYTGTKILGGDLSFPLSRAIGLEGHDITLEGSVIYRDENDIPEMYRDLGLEIPNGNLGWSARLNYEWSGLSFKGEYVGKGEDLYLSESNGDFELRSGNAQLAQIDWSGDGFSVMGTFRRLDNMKNQAYRTAGNYYASNTLNYLPAMTPQHTYLLAVLNPYSPFVSGEVGGQVDLFYKFGKNTLLGGATGWKLHGNYSLYHSLAKATSNGKNNFLYRDVTFDAEKKWNKKLKTTLFMSIQEYANDHGNGVSALTTAQNVFVADVLYKFNGDVSLRGELQHLYSQESTKDWCAALVELALSSSWNIYLSDMYNHGDTKVHYYSAGVSYSHSIFRIAFNYGRNKAGYVCSGGVCRYQPQYTGGNLAATITF